MLGIVGYGAGRPADRAGDPTYFIHAGQRYLAPDMLPADSFVETATGYDGQFFFYLAQDPLLSGKAASRDESTSDHVDNVPYRYQRILLPVLGWVASAEATPICSSGRFRSINILACAGAPRPCLRDSSARAGAPPGWPSPFPPRSGFWWECSTTSRTRSPRPSSSPVSCGGWRTRDRSRRGGAGGLPAGPGAVHRALSWSSVLSRWPATGRRGFVWFLPAAVLGLWQLVLQIALSGSPTK